MKCHWHPRHLLLITLMVTTFVTLSEQLEASGTSFGNDTQAKLSSETSFLDWKKWRKKYLLCNPKRNPSTSPIDIFSSRVEKVENRQTLMIHSAVPEEDIYIFSTFYDVDNVQMESFNIKLRGDDVLRDATYISGLDSSTHRFLKSALIMFLPGKDNEPLHQRQSFHVIDDKEYQMEIMLTFETQMGLEKTQIHVLVELGEEENPAWKPILDVFSELKEKLVHDACFGEEHLRTAQANLKSAEALRREGRIQQKNETHGLSYKRTVKELMALESVVKGIGNEVMENLTVQQLDSLVKRHNCLQESISVDNEIGNLEQKVVMRRSEGDLGMLNELILKKANLSKCIGEEGKKAEKFRKEWSRQTALLKKIRVGNESTDVFRSVEDLTKLLNESKEKMEALEKLENEYDDALHEIEKLKRTPKRSVFIKDPFQISWLLPAEGGFFFYNGSSPVPPCKGRPHVIVLEQSITITAEQLNQFQMFPSITQTNSSEIAKICQLKRQGKTDDDNEIDALISAMKRIRSQVPPIKPLGERTVYYNPKNIQFKEDDGMHMKSSTRRKLRELHKVKNSSGKLTDGQLMAVWWLYFYIFYYPS